MRMRHVRNLAALVFVAVVFLGVEARAFDTGFFCPDGCFCYVSSTFNDNDTWVTDCSMMTEEYCNGPENPPYWQFDNDSYNSCVAWDGTCNGTGGGGGHWRWYTLFNNCSTECVCDHNIDGSPIIEG